MENINYLEYKINEIINGDYTKEEKIELLNEQKLLIEKELLMQGNMPLNTNEIKELIKDMDGIIKILNIDIQNLDNKYKKTLKCILPLAVVSNLCTLYILYNSVFNYDDLTRSLTKNLAPYIVVLENILSVFISGLFDTFIIDTINEHNNIKAQISSYQRRLKNNN